MNDDNDVVMEIQFFCYLLMFADVCCCLLLFAVVCCCFADPFFADPFFSIPSFFILFSPALHTTWSVHKNHPRKMDVLIRSS